MLIQKEKNIQIKFVKNTMFKYLFEIGINETTKLKKGNIKIKTSMFNYVLINVLINTSKINKIKSLVF